MRVIVILVLVIFVAGCATRPVSVKPSIAALPVELTIPCERPAALPERELSQSETEKYWNGDRANLVECGDRHAAHVESVADRDARLTGRKAK